MKVDESWIPMKWLISNQFQSMIFLELQKLNLSIYDMNLSIDDMCFHFRDNPMCGQCHVFT